MRAGKTRAAKSARKRTDKAKPKTFRVTFTTDHSQNLSVLVKATGAEAAKQTVHDIWDDNGAEGFTPEQRLVIEGETREAFCFNAVEVQP